MEMTDENKTFLDRFEKCYSTMNFIWGVIMVAIGGSYLPTAKDEADDMPIMGDAMNMNSTTTPEKSDPCPNGAAYYIYVGGIIIVLSSLLNIGSKIAKYCAAMDGQISSNEAFCLILLKVASVIMVITDIVVLFWGTGLVFGAWSTWTDNYAKYAADPANYNYCAYAPMMLPFIYLVIKWFFISSMAVVGCCACCACLVAGGAEGSILKR
eukprot:GFUD01022845.1.p1 GENE.GFUD01022845.1~~GFUD01022845.1.p1  ORF type:complete len:210 (-),score=31.25 GFUD01022845.1:126-755(-)